MAKHKAQADAHPWVKRALCLFAWGTSTLLWLSMLLEGRAWWNLQSGWLLSAVLNHFLVWLLSSDESVELRAPNVQLIWSTPTNGLKSTRAWLQVTWEALATGNVCGVDGGRFLRDQDWNSQLKWGEPMNRKHPGNCNADNVGIFSWDTAPSHTEPTTEGLKTEIQAAILSPIYCDLSHSNHRVTHRPVQI